MRIRYWEHVENTLGTRWGTHCQLEKHVENSLGTGWGTHCQLEKHVEIIENMVGNRLRTWGTCGELIGNNKEISKQTPTLLKKGEKKNWDFLGTCLLARLLSLIGCQEFLCLS